MLIEPPSILDILFLRRTITLDRLYVGYTEHGLERDRIWHEFKTKKEAREWATQLGFTIVLMD